MTQIGWPSPDERRRIVDLVAKRLGGKAALGRRLGYRDGAFVGQMIRGDRAVTEKTLAAMATWPDTKDLFGAPFEAREVVANYAVPADTQTLSQCVERLGMALASAPTDVREALATNLAGWARSGGKEPWTTLVIGLLSPPPAKRIGNGRQ